MSVHVTTVNATRIVPTPMVPISVPAILDIKFLLITKLVLVRNSYTVYVFETCNSKRILCHYQYTFTLFVDIAVCAHNISGCNQNCTNTNGSFFCSCYPGYEILNEYRTCVGKEFTHCECV